MIAKVVRGWRPAGLLRYLFGPGKYEEHRDPRVVASWDGAPWLHQPEPLPRVILDGEVLPSGEFDLDLRPLTASLQDPATAAGLPSTNPPAMTPQWAEVLRSGRRLPVEAPEWLRHYKYDPRTKAVVLRPGFVWHCPVRLHPDDPVLSDAQWQRIADRLMRATGIQQAGCRWIAVRHADDHIHLMATLVSETTGRRFHPYRDYLKLRAECQAIERELGLVATASADRTAAPAPTRAEKGKAERHGRALTAREELRRRVSQCAAITSTGPDFLTALHRDGLSPRAVRTEAGEIRGYSVTLPGDLTAAGEQVRFSGGQLAPDLTWPTLLTRWAGLPATPASPRTDDGRVPLPERRATLERAAAAVTAATTSVRQIQDVDVVAHATGELFAVLSRATDGYVPGPLTHAHARFDRATRAPHQVVPLDLGAVARDLRQTARQLGAIGVLTGRGHEKFALTTLLIALAGLVTEIAAWQQQHGRTHQAAAARQTLQSLPAPTRTRRPPSLSPSQPATTPAATSRRATSTPDPVRRQRRPLT